MLKDFGDEVIRRARLNLGATQDRWGISAKWKNGKPKSFKRKKSKRHISRGNLNRSLRYQVDGSKITFYMADYGEWVDIGRQGKKDAWGIEAKSSAKGMPIDIARKWAKKLRPKDENNKFVKKTPQVMESLAFLINRKIKWFGIAPSHFFRDAVTDSLKADEDLGLEIINNIFDGLPRT